VRTKRILALAMSALFVAAACTSTATTAPTAAPATAAPATAAPATAAPTAAPGTEAPTMAPETGAPTPNIPAASLPKGLNEPIGGADRANQEYVWISNASNLPLFVERVYPGLESARKALNVKVRIAGPSSVDLAAFLATVDTECTAGPAGVIVVGGWDDALASEVDKCIEKKVPTVVTDGDLPMSKRLAYVGTDWYQFGRVHGSYQCKFHKERGLASGKLGTISFLAAGNFIRARQGLRDQLKEECPTVEVVADEESGTNVEQVAANTAAILQAHPDLTGMVGMDSEAGPGIVRAISEAGKTGQVIVTSNEAGREFMNSLKDGSTLMVNMEKYETMDYFAVFYLYSFHNDLVRIVGIDPWTQNPLPPLGDSGLIIVTKDNVEGVLTATDPKAPKAQPAGISEPIGGASRADQEYVWISQFSSLPMFVARVYPGLEYAKLALNVKVRVAGPAAIDLAGFVATVETECTKNPAGVIVVGGWDTALAPAIDKCIDMKVPTVVTDGDLPMSKRLSYLGTNWTQFGVIHGHLMCEAHKARGLTEGKVATITILAADSYIKARKAYEDTLAAECPGVKVVAHEEGGDSQDAVVARVAAVLQANPDLTGLDGMESEGGGAMITAVTEAGKKGKVIIISNDYGRDFLLNLKDGSVDAVTLEKYETMDFFGVVQLYTFHNDIIRNLYQDPWFQNPLPPLNDTGLVTVDKSNVDTIYGASEGIWSQ
jgi:ABC-type sugar transport system substrate-binding protein